MSRSSLLPGEGSVSGQSSMGRLPQEGPPHCQPFKEPGPLGLPGALLTISPRIAPPSEAPLLSFPPSPEASHPTPPPPHPTPSPATRPLSHILHRKPLISS